MSNGHEDALILWDKDPAWNIEGRSAVTSHHQNPRCYLRKYFIISELMDCYLGQISQELQQLVQTTGERLMQLLDGLHRGSLFDMIHQPYKLRWHGELTVSLSLSLGKPGLHKWKLYKQHLVYFWWSCLKFHQAEDWYYLRTFPVTNAYNTI